MNVSDFFNVLLVKNVHFMIHTYAFTVNKFRTTKAIKKNLYSFIGNISYNMYSKFQVISLHCFPEN